MITYDLKGILMQVLTVGLQDFNYGVRSTGFVNPPVGSDSPTISITRTGAQDEVDAPRIFLKRMGAPTARVFFLGNVSDPMAGTNAEYAKTILVEDRVRIGIEAFHDTGGQSLVDMLVLQIPTMLLQNWNALTYPIEVGGYGLIGPTFRGGEDTVKSNIVGGKAVYSNYIDFTATLPMDVSDPNAQPIGTIDYIEFLPTLTNVDPNDPNFQPNP